MFEYFESDQVHDYWLIHPIIIRIYLGLTPYSVSRWTIARTARKAPASRNGVVGQMETSIDLLGLLSRQHISTTSRTPKLNTLQVMAISLGINDGM